ncbi:hypothetical protein PHLCEN_2v5616 [Hermanssonia centrifuga]|uniref:N-acetyltransferase domain-containing protein n=1 Tax=Hermanssonia centrifuga TaxID=98765 RepID=A0A2R6P1X6_9APHY|nr:hypothetical protein PHLCEN_2v5616 [Hermanssonia centrifuga]
MTALQLMLSYATSPASLSPLPVPKDRLVVRIGEKNEASRRLFEKLGFVVTKRVEVFEEIEMRFEASGKLSEDQSRSWRTGEIRPFVL